MMEYLIIIALTIALIIQSYRASHWKMFCELYRNCAEFWEKVALNMNKEDDSNDN